MIWLQLPSRANDLALASLMRASTRVGMGDTTGFSAKLIQQDVIAIKRNLVPTCAAALALLGGQATTVTTPVELGCAMGVKLCGAKVAVPARKRCGWGTAVTSVKYVVSAWDDRSSQWPGM